MSSRTGHLLTDRLGGARVPAGRHPGQHPLHHHPGEHVIGGEVRVAAQRHLMPVDGAGPGPGHRNLAAAQGDPATPGAVTHRGPARPGSCLPFGPHASAISASNIACITAIPAATLIASSPSRTAPAMSVTASWISSGTRATRRQRQRGER